eukprot:GHVS01091478.1.p1 GENE.GHVS01091478.1~~GHVS01091478.1.p1  ORF type:complete len:442 (-),score=38.84 GHVS01091478.1:872-2197(-)
MFVKESTAKMRITEELVRRRAEHNEGSVCDLEELTLHQYEIEKIENLQQLCRHLKILYLQNNIIDRIENVGKLKELEYLNLALNNITVVENLQKCESLKKLDLTVNFVDLANFETSLQNLQANEALEDLYFVGNPCAEWSGYRSFAILHLGNLRQLDGKEVLPSERINARKEEASLRASMADQLRKTANKQSDENLEEPVESEGAYTRENRTKMYREMAEDREKKEARQDSDKGAAQPKEPLSVYTKSGDIRQCNEGKYKFSFDDYSDPHVITINMFVPRHLDTSLIEADVHPTYVRCLIKGKLTQLRLPSEVRPATSKIDRSKTTGALRITMPLESSPSPQPSGRSQAKPANRGPITRRPENGIKQAVGSGQAISGSSGNLTFAESTARQCRSVESRCGGKHILMPTAAGKSGELLSAVKTERYGWSPACECKLPILFLV